jgi:hypothetical protein
MWFYGFNNQQMGPVDEAAIRNLITNQTIKRDTLVWRQGMANWQAAETSALAVFFAPLSQTVSIAPPIVFVPGYSKTPEMEIKELNDLFMWYWICLIGMVVTFGLSGIASVVLFYIIVYKSWKLIQDGYARTTPGKAVGFNFIPFFNFYWIFEAFPGLVKDTNAYIQRYNLPVAMKDTGLATAFCILTLLSLIPYVGYVTGVAVFIIEIILLKSYKDTATAIIRARK